MSINAVVIVSAPADKEIASSLLVALDAWGITSTVLEPAMFATFGDTQPVFADCLILLWSVSLSASLGMEQHFAAWLASLVTAEGDSPQRIIQLRLHDATLPVERVAPLPMIDTTSRFPPWRQSLANALGVQIRTTAAASAPQQQNTTASFATPAWQTQAQASAIMHDPRFRWRQQVGEQRALQLALDGDQLVTASDMGITSVDRHTGDVLWQRRDLPSMKSFFHVPTVTIGLDHIFTSTEQAIYALRRANGATLWTTPIDDTIRPNMAIGDDTLFAATDKGSLYAWNKTNGELRWQARLPGGFMQLAPLVIDEQRVYCGSRDSYVYASSAHDGTLLWKSLVGDSIFGKPTLAEGRLYINGYSTDIYALDAASGAVIWNVDVGQGSGSPLLLDGVLYRGSSKNGVVTAVRAADGAVLWRSGSHGRIDDTLADDSAADTLVVLGMAGAFYTILSRLDGTRLWSMRNPSLVHGSEFVLHDGTLFFVADDGYLYAYAFAAGPDEDTTEEE